MPNLVVTYEHERISLNTLTQSWFNGLLVGLHQTDAQPQRDWTIARIQPAVFSGYAGKIPILSWYNAVLDGQVAKTKAAPLGWYHDGGPVSGYVCGYYVVDRAGVLRWAYTDDPPYSVMQTAGQIYVVRPDFSLQSWFPI